MGVRGMVAWQVDNMRLAVVALSRAQLPVSCYLPPFILSNTPSGCAVMRILAYAPSIRTSGPLTLLPLATPSASEARGLWGRAQTRSQTRAGGFPA
jgi:hypothetical protein